MEAADKRSSATPQTIPEDAPCQHDQAPNIQRSDVYLNIPPSRLSTQKGASSSADKPCNLALRDHRLHPSSSTSLRLAASSRAIKFPPIEIEPGATTAKPRQRISVKDIRLDGLDQTAWHEYEIPKELEILGSSTPAKIRLIIQGTLEERRAIRLSKLPAPVINTESKSPPVEAARKVAGSSLKGSERHTGSTSSDQTQSFDLSLKSTTSLGSSTVGMDSYNPLDRKAAEVNSQPTNTRLQKCREKPSGAHGLLKMLRNPRKILSAPGMEPEPSTYECTSCFDKVPKSKAIGVLCQHRYRAICFSQLIATALQNENNFPPKCCLQEIPRRVLQKHLRAKELAVFDNKALEFAVAIGSRYYCARPKCSKWIDTTKARSRNGALRCPHCRYSMCMICRGSVHPVDQDCPQDFGLNSTLEQAEKAGCQRCYKCRALVELDTGCRHITCKCRAEFWSVFYPTLPRKTRAS